MKKFFIIITVFIMMGICGCIPDNSANKAEKIKNKALEYLNANYDDTFVAIGYSDGDWAYNYDTVSFISEKYPDRNVEVRVCEGENGKYQFKDNYYHCYMLDDAINYGKSLIIKEDAVVKVRFPDSVWSDELSGTRTFEE